jgi:single-strand DNA-binding protein
VNVAVLRGHLSRAPEVRTLPSGDVVVAYEVTVRPSDGPAETVPVAWPDAPVRAQRLAADTEVVVVGRVRRRFFRTGGVLASRTEVVADGVHKPGAAGARAAVARAADALADLVPSPG